RSNRCGRRSFWSCRRCFFSSRRRHTRWPRDWSSDVCSSDLSLGTLGVIVEATFKVMPVSRRERSIALRLRSPSDACGLAAELYRSEERRVGKECRSRWSSYHVKKKYSSNALNL